MPDRSSASPFGGTQLRAGLFLDGLTGKRGVAVAQRVGAPAGSPNPPVDTGGLERFSVADIRSAVPTVAPFEVRVQPNGEAVRVLAVGELDMASAPELRATVEELSAAGFERVVLDLRGLWFIDVHGVRLILACRALAERDGFELSLIAGPRAVQRVFELTELDNRLPFRPA